MSLYVYKTIWNKQPINFQDPNKDRLMIMVEQWHQKNNINYSRESISYQIDRQSKVVKPEEKKKKTFAEVLNGAAALVKYTVGSSASNQEITRRSQICLQCPVRSAVGGCAPCGAAAKIANAVNQIRAKKGAQMAIDSDLRNQYCKVCDCGLPLMLLTEYKDFHYESEEMNIRRPDFCWLKRTSPNYTHE